MRFTCLAVDFLGMGFTMTLMVLVFYGIHGVTLWSNIYGEALPELAMLAAILALQMREAAVSLVP